VSSSHRVGRSCPDAVAAAHMKHRISSDRMAVSKVAAVYSGSPGSAASASGKPFRLPKKRGPPFLD
jgi:hypothetical protein